VTLPTVRRRDDAGASLLLTMAFLVGVGLVLGGLLNYAHASIVAETATLAHAQTVADTGAALQAGINDIRTSGYNFDNGDGNCFSGATPGPA
jgi:hypothetical protein